MVTARNGKYVSTTSSADTVNMFTAVYTLQTAAPNGKAIHIQYVMIKPLFVEVW